jgi:hypothetical protein
VPHPASGDLNRLPRREPDAAARRTSLRIHRRTLRDASHAHVLAAAQALPAYSPHQGLLNTATRLKTGHGLNGLVIGCSP